MTASALLYRDEKAVAGGVGVHRLVEQHALDISQQLFHHPWWVEHRGQEVVGNHGENGRPALFRDAIGRRCKAAAHQREEAPAHHHGQEGGVEQGPRRRARS